MQAEVKIQKQSIVQPVQQQRQQASRKPRHERAYYEASPTRSGGRPSFKQQERDSSSENFSSDGD